MYMVESVLTDTIVKSGIVHADACGGVVHLLSPGPDVLPRTVQGDEKQSGPVLAA